MHVHNSVCIEFQDITHYLILATKHVTQTERERERGKETNHQSVALCMFIIYCSKAQHSLLSLLVWSGMHSL